MEQETPATPETSVHPSMKLHLHPRHLGIHPTASYQAQFASHSCGAPRCTALPHQPDHRLAPGRGPAEHGKAAEEGRHHESLGIALLPMQSHTPGHRHTMARHTRYSRPPEASPAVGPVTDTKKSKRRSFL